MKRVASPGSMHDTGCLGLVHWNDPEGWYGEGGPAQRGVGEIACTHGLGQQDGETAVWVLQGGARLLPDGRCVKCQSLGGEVTGLRGHAMN